MDRREFLIAAGTAGVALAAPAGAGAADPARSPSASSFYVDAQGALDGFDEPEPGKYVPTQKLIDAVRQRRIDLICATISDVGNGAGADRFRNAAESVASYDKLIAEHPALLAKIETAADIRKARAAGKLGFIYNFQDTVALESDSGRVATFATLGVKVMQLTYNKRNLSGDGCLERANAGLSDFGREVIAKINQSNVLLDLSHAGQRTIAEGIAASAAPASITHSSCRSLVDLPRNTGDAEMRALAQKDGVFGIYMMPFLRAKGQPQREDLIRHIEHALNICGEDHIGIGTDNPLLGYTINAETRKRHRESHEDRVKRGVAAPGEQPDVLLYVDGYNDVARYDRLAADLRRRGWSAARIDKLVGGNFLRLFGEVWKA